MSKGMLAALLLSILLAVSLSLLPERALDRFGGDAFGGGAQAQRDVPVMKMDGVVDELGTLKLSSHLQKVVFEKDTLIVYLAIPTAKLKQSQSYRDIYSIFDRFLVGSPYYKRVEVRVVANERPDQVRYTVQTDRQQMQNALQPGSPEAKAFIEGKLKINAGSPKQ